MAGKNYTLEDMIASSTAKGTPEPPGLNNFVNKVTAQQAPADIVVPAAVAPEEKPAFFSETLPAALRTSNTLYGAWHEALESEFHPVQRDYKFADHAEELRKGVPEQYWDRLVAPRSLEGGLKERKDILAELEDKETIRKAGFVGTAAELGCMLADAPTLIGGFGEAYALGNMLTKGARIKNMISTGAIGVLAAVGQEAALQQSTHTRGTEDLIYAGVYGTVLTGALGAFSKHGKELSKSIMSDMDRRLIAETPMEYATREQVIQHLSTDGAVPTEESIGAALKANALEVDTHTAARKAAMQTAVDSSPNLALHVNDVNIFDKIENTVTEFVNGIKGSYKKVVQNDGSTLSMFIPFEGASGSGVKRVPSPKNPDLNIEPPALLSTEEVQAEVKKSARNRALKSSDVYPESASATDAAQKEVKQEVLDAQGNVVPAARDILADAQALEKSGVFKNLTETRTGKALMKLGFTDSSWLLSQNSPVSKMISYELLENGAGIAGRTSTAAIQKFQHLKVMLSTFMPDLSASYKQFAHENNISHWNLKKYYGEGMEQWNKELRFELESRRNAFREGIEHQSQAVKHIQDAADALQRAADHALDIAKAKGVRGFEDIVRQPGYVPLIWKGKALRLATPEKRTAYADLLTQGYTAALGMEKADAKKIADAVITRALHNDLGIDANPRSLFSADSRTFLRASLERTEMSPHSIDELFARIDARQGDKGMSARARRRTDIDLLVKDAHGNSLLDIVDNDLPMLFNRYSSEMSGRSALASKGITSEADWTRLREKAILEASAHGDDVDKLKKVLDSNYEQLLGRPAGGGVNKNVRRLMDMATVASLGQVGFAQMAEWAPIMAAHGVGGMFEMLPEVKAYRLALKNGTLDRGVLSELHVHCGRIGEEEMLFRPDIRLDDKLSDDPEWLRILDRGIGTLNDVSGKLSLMHQIKTMQQQFVVSMQANKVAKAVANGEWSKLSARFADLGWDDKFLKDLQAASKHFEFDGGTLQRLNMDKWHNPELTENFIQGLHRHTNQLIQMQMVGETAHWMHPTIGAMLTQFRTFPLVAMEKQTARHMLMADEEAVFTAMYGLGLSSLVYTAKVGFNSIGKGKDKQQYLNDRLSIESIAKGALQYANVAGPIQDVSNLAVAAGLAPKFMSSSNVGRTGGDKMANLSLSDIPSLGTGLKLFNAATGMGKGLLDPSYDYKKRDLQNLQGGLPLGNTPFLTIPWNVAKDSIE